ncbi:glycosyltransferase family 4 protein [Gaetbulibacter aquiaggeris]|uniref:Glycosyltransferase family 4 protein n=1 Tax=Gaetbulibacter aquiaggeris TaxID=1735373 RepID=A0ABW7MS12_9FLAO
MKNLLYIGNHLSKTGKTETTIETLSKSLRLEGYKVFAFSNKRNKLVRLFDMLFAILKYAIKVDYVLIDTYSTSNFYYAFLCSQLCRIVNLKFIPILHGGNLPKRIKSNPKLSKAIFKNAFINISPSTYIQSEFSKQGFSNVMIIPNAIDLKNYPFKLREFKTIKLLWVRSFSEIYNPLLAVKIVKSLKDEGLNASLCMVGPEGDGTLEKTKDYAKALGVDVIFTGKLSKNEWIKMSTDYNVFLNTTNFDNMPVSVIEAMALGLPIISTNVGGLPFLINHNEDGILVNRDDVSEFVDAIKEIRSCPDKAIKLAQNARRKVEGYDWDKIKSQWISLLD